MTVIEGVELKMPMFGSTDASAAAKANPAPAVPPRRRHVRELYNPDQMTAVLRRERARSDRQHVGFSIVLFRLDDQPLAKRTLMRLATILLKCIRETDELGCYDERTLCAVLPDTGPAGAAMLVARAKKETAPKAYHPICTIYTYPDPPSGGGRTTFNDRMHGDGTGMLAPDAPQVEIELDAAMDDFAGTTPVDINNMSVHAMSELFAEPLPWWKRLLDIAVSSAAIVAASPVMIAAALAIKLSSSGPIIFAQQRTGLGGDSFTIFKFRTMRVGAEAEQAKLRGVSEQDGPAFKLTDDPRVFPVGKFLRKTSIDELPQLFNILLGDMTLVGPRPLPVKEADAVAQWQQRRHDVTPGLTCIWQVEGRSRVKFDEWMRMDMRYAKRRSIFKDLALVAKTIPAVLMRRGAN
jgi:lipopolysaccharide/colanic/teichoic acid biosynthesis glycosyltransferase